MRWFFPLLILSFYLSSVSSQCNTLTLTTPPLSTSVSSFNLAVISSTNVAYSIKHSTTASVVQVDVAGGHGVAATLNMTQDNNNGITLNITSLGGGGSNSASRSFGSPSSLLTAACAATAMYTMRDHISVPVVAVGATFVGVASVISSVDADCIARVTITLPTQITVNMDFTAASAIVGSSLCDAGFQFDSKLGCILPSSTFSSQYNRLWYNTTDTRCATALPASLTVASGANSGTITLDSNAAYMFKTSATAFQDPLLIFQHSYNGGGVVTAYANLDSGLGFVAVEVSFTAASAGFTCQAAYECSSGSCTQSNYYAHTSRCAHLTQYTNVTSCPDRNHNFPYSSLNCPGHSCDVYCPTVGVANACGLSTTTCPANVTECSGIKCSCGPVSASSSQIMLSFSFYILVIIAAIIMSYI